MKQFKILIALTSTLLMVGISCNSVDTELFSDAGHLTSRAGDNNTLFNQNEAFKIGWDYITIANGKYAFNMTSSQAMQLGISDSDYNTMKNTINGANNFIYGYDRLAEISDLETIHIDSVTYRDDVTSVEFDSITMVETPHALQKLPGESTGGYDNNGVYIGYLTLWIPYGCNSVNIELSAMYFFNVYICQVQGSDRPYWGCSGIDNGYCFNISGLSSGSYCTFRITTYGGAPTIYYKYCF